MKSYRFLGLLFLVTLLWVSACSTRLLPQPPGSTPLPLDGPKTGEETASINPTPGLPETLVDFHVQIPDDTPTSDSVYLTLLDEVTGLFLNAQSFPMTLDQSTGIYSLQLPFPVGSVIKYRYERQGDELSNKGLYLDLPAWGCHLFEITISP